ncbi:hypothetical protein RN001_009677 [Aquatica leii]|uniref:Dynein axonemal assembly factor 1 homolog n=1 Tax=Aquatica leii TaxID=1421715 RepID=A0AAN7S890_9COLE|nr:hypothetical protein RN001_009677 [Aquatica leii]
MDRCKKEEPKVINSAMLIKCIEENAPRGEAGRLQREEGIPFDEIEDIRLEFQKILRIDHLWMLTALTKLSLSNNLIEHIENLNELVNLKELDLSFNKISKIENIDMLVNIEILSFFENNISKIENMKPLTKLLIFTIGNNKIEDRKNVIYLRQFRYLQSVNMKGNPCAEADDFILFITTVLPQITYYQYKLVNVSDREIGAEKYHYLLKDTLIEEARLKKIQEQIEAELAEAQLHAGSFVEFLGTDYLFEQMFKDDTEGRALMAMDSNCQARHAEYKEQFVTYTKKIFDMGQVQYIIRKTEVEQFFDCINMAKSKSQGESIEKMEAFLAQKEEIFAKVKTLEENYENNVVTDEECNDILQKYADDYNDLLHQVWKELMGLELNLYEQMEDVISNFEQTVTEMVNIFIEAAQGFFTEIRTLETNYQEFLSTEATGFLTSFTANEHMPMSDELRVIMSDKEVLTNALGATHDLHMLTIDIREDTLVNKARAWLYNLVSSLTKDEVTRNRGKVLEINHFLDIQREEFEDLQSFTIGGALDPEVSAVLQ